MALYSESKLQNRPSLAYLVFGPCPNSAWKKPKIDSHCGYPGARHLLDEMLQEVTRVLDVAFMQSSRPHHCCSVPLPSTRDGDTPSRSQTVPTPPARPHSLLLALRRGNAAASAVADGMSSHLPQCSLLRASSAQAKYLSASAVSS